MREKHTDRDANFLERFEEEPSVPPVHMKVGTRGPQARGQVQPPDLSKMGDEDEPVDEKVQAILDDLED